VNESVWEPTIYLRLATDVSKARVRLCRDNLRVTGTLSLAFAMSYMDV